MPRRRAIFLALVCLMAVAAVILGLLNGPRPGPEERITAGSAAGTEGAFLKPRPQEIRERVWRDMDFREVATIRNTRDVPLVMPLHVRVDRAGSVYVLDWSERRVKKYGPSGEFIMQFGLGEGRAPGEFSNLSDFDVSGDGSLWACDPVNGLITVFRADGSIKTTVRPERPPHRIALLDGGSYAVVSFPIGGRMFRVYAEDDRTLADLGAFMDQQARLGVALDGRIASTGSGGFAFAAYRAGVIAVSTDRADSVAVLRQTLDHGGLPDVLVSRSGETEYARTDPDAPIVTRSISCSDGEIHLLLGAEGRPGHAAMDVYDVRSGSYRYSYDLPADALAACATTTRVVTVSDTTVTIWERLETPAGR